MTNTAVALDGIRIRAGGDYMPLFPLPLVPFELFLLQDERPGFPMTFCVELVFLGRMNRQALVQAVADAAVRHPLLLARVARGPTGWQWMLDAEQFLPFDEQDAAEPYRPPRGVELDLRSESGLRTWIREDGERTSVTFQFHHACCDGEGARHFGHDVLTGYTRLITGDARPEWSRIDYERLRARAIFLPPTTQAAPPPTTSTWQKLKDAYQFHVLGPSALSAPRTPFGGTAASRVNGEPGTPRPWSIKRLFTREETARIEARALGSSSTLNDVALALLFQTLGDWNRDQGQAAAGQRIRVLMPTDLRERADRCLTAANRTSFSFLTRTIGQCSDWSALLTGISQETQYIKRIRLGLDFINIMGSVQRVPGLFPVLLSLPRCMATAVLTNVGDITRRFRRRFPFTDGYPVIGDVRLEQVVGAPPLRRRTHSGFGICYCSGHMTISLRPDPAHLDAPAAQALLDGYIDAWQRWATSR